MPKLAHRSPFLGFPRVLTSSDPHTSPRSAPVLGTRCDLKGRGGDSNGNPPAISAREAPGETSPSKAGSSSVLELPLAADPWPEGAPLNGRNLEASEEEEGWAASCSPLAAFAAKGHLGRLQLQPERAPVPAGGSQLGAGADDKKNL